MELEGDIEKGRDQEGQNQLLLTVDGSTSWVFRTFTETTQNEVVDKVII